MVSRQEAYTWVGKTLRKFEYLSIGKRHKGLVLKYIQVMTGYSKPQVVRFVAQYRKTGYVRAKKYKRHTFPNQYTKDDIQRLAKTDDLHNYPCGQSLKTTLEREYKVFGKDKYKNISQISVSHIYNIRKTTAYKRTAKNYIPTKPTVTVNLGERRKPDPQGKPGYIRVDSVHQGNKDDQKGLYHINTVDEVLQFENIAATAKISERFLIPILELLLETYPYTNWNFMPTMDLSISTSMWFNF